MKKTIYSICTMLFFVLSIKGFGQCSTASTPTNISNPNYQIIQVSMGALSAPSGNVGPTGYTNSTATSFTLQSGTQEPIYLYGASPYQYSYAVFIDLNQDNVYSSNELIMSSTGSTNGGGNIFIPYGSTVGTPYKMRVRANYVVSTGPIPDACTSYTNVAGETEDFTVYFTCPTSWDNILFPLQIQTLGESYSNSKVCNNSGFLAVKTNSAIGTYTWLPSGVTNAVLPVSTSNNSVTYTLIASMVGCPSVTNTVSRTFSILQTPTISVSGNTTICNEQSTTLTGSGATTYLWTHLGGGMNPISVSPTTTTVYTVTGITNDVDFPVSQAFTGCKHTLTPTVQVVAGPTISISNTTVCAGSSFTLNPTGATSYTYSGGSAVVTPTATSVYTITGSNGSCASSKNVTITTAAGPTITVSSGSICVGSSFTINPSGATSYTYSSGSAIVSPSTTSTYVVTGSNGGCSTSKTVTVTIQNGPVISAATSPTICSGSWYQFQATGATSYTFSSSTSTLNATTSNTFFPTTNSITPTSSVTYTITGNIGAGCVSNPIVTNITVNPTPTITASNGTICAGASFTINPSGATTYTYSGGSSVVAPTTNTTYVVTGSNGVCSSTKNVTVTVNPLPNSSINIQNQPYCPNAITNIGFVINTVTVAVNGSPVAQDQFFNYTYSAAATQTLNFVFTNTLTGCTRTQTPIVYNVLSNTITISSSSANPICSGQSAILTASVAGTPANLAWSNASVFGNTTTITPTVTTTYTIAGQDQAGYGCNYSATYTQSVSTCTGIEEATNNNLVSIYPNPANDFMTVSLVTEPTDATIIYIINALGEIVVTEKPTSTRTTLNIEKLTNGIYFVKVESKNGSAIKKFIKN